MALSPSVLLLDDGELDDVRALLDEVGADYVHLRGGEIPERVEQPRELFIATSRRAMVARAWTGSFGAGTGPMKISIVVEDSNTLRNMLRRIGFDLLVRRPVHPYALKLLMLRALYRGDERRREQRVAVGCEVSYRLGLRRPSAILADLSTRGCRLLSKRKLEPGTRLTLHLPKELTEGKALAVRAIVVRQIDGDPAAGPDQYSLGLGFEQLPAAARRVILQILKSRVASPAVLSAETAQQVGARSTESGSTTPIAAAASEDNRRKHHRASFEREVVLLDDEASKVLVGRDISMGGMRVDSGSGLEAGQLLNLAVYATAREEPFILKARVLRDDGENVALEFEDVPASIASRLDALVGALPSVESLDDELDAMGSVVTKILDR